MAALAGEAVLRPYLTRHLEPYAEVTVEDVAASLDGLLSDVDRAALTGEFAHNVTIGLLQAVSPGEVPCVGVPLERTRPSPTIRLVTRRRNLRETFESAAATYHRVRPRYPEALFDALEQSAGLAAPADLLEIGTATGIATEPMARRGYRITCVELGPTLAARARENLATHPDVLVVCASFDTWTPPAWGAFDLVYAATAWHWLDPATRYQRAHRHLRPGGALAFWSATHVVPEDGDPFFVELQDVYDEIGESQPDDWHFPGPGELADQVGEITDSGLFAPVTVRHFDWETTYDADGYIALLDTFSGHRTMQPWQRHRLYGEILRRLAERPTGTVRRHWGAVLHVAIRTP